MIYRKDAHKKMLSDLENYIGSLIFNSNEMREKLNNWNRDAEIQGLKEQIQMLKRNSLHIMSENEMLELDDFRNAHFDSCKGNTKQILLGTGVGTSITLECTGCKAQKNITDTANW